MGLAVVYLILPPGYHPPTIGPIRLPALGGLKLPARPQPGQAASRTPTDSGWAISVASSYPAAILPHSFEMSISTLDAQGRAILSLLAASGTAFDPDLPDAKLMFESRGVTTVIAVYDPDGSLAWTYALPSMLGESVPLRIRTAPDGTIYLVGQFWGTIDFDSGPGTSELTGPPELDERWQRSAGLFCSPAFANDMSLPRQSYHTFLLSLTADGQFRWVRQWESWSDFDPVALAVSPAGEPHLLMTIWSGSDVDPGPAELKVPNIGQESLPPRLVLVRLDAQGAFAGHRVWPQFFRASPGFDMQLDFDAAGNAYIAGTATAPADLAPQPGSFPLASLGPDRDQFLFLEKLDPTGALLWVDTWQTYSTSEVHVHVAPSGHTVIAGATHTYTPLDFDPGPGEHIVTRTDGSNDTGFVMSLDPAGALEWVRTEDDSLGRLHAVARAPDGAVYLAGMFRYTEDFDPGAAKAVLTAIDYSSDPRAAAQPRDDYPHDAYLVRFTPQGDFDWVTSWGGKGQDTATALHIDALGRVILTGYSEGETDLDPGPQTATHPAKKKEGRNWIVSLDPKASF